MLTYTGRLLRGKGLATLLEAFREVAAARAARAPLPRGLGPGPGPLGGGRASRRGRAARALRGRVVFTGRVDNVEDHLRASDVFVFPSEFEALGLSLIEAAACGLPAVGSRTGGIVDVIEHEGSGLLVPPGDAGGSARRARRLLADEALRRGMGSARPGDRVRAVRRGERRVDAAIAALFTRRRRRSARQEREGRLDRRHRVHRAAGCCGPCVRGETRSRALARPASVTSGAADSGATVVEGDLADAAALARLVEGVRRRPARRGRLSNRGPPRSLLPRGQRRRGPSGCSRRRRASGVRGSSTPPPWAFTATSSIPRPTRPRPSRPGDVYQATKAEAEALALAFGRKRGLPVAVVRPGGDLRARARRGC